MRIFEIIVEGYREAQAEFAHASSDDNLVKTTIDQYKQLVSKNQVQGQERNIDYWRKQGWDKFAEFVKARVDRPTDTQIKRQRAVGKSINLLENNDWLVVIPLDKNASCFYGKDSSWCTAKPHQPFFEKYFYDNEIVLIYCINKTTGAKWAIAGHKDLKQTEHFDQNDNPITAQLFSTKTGLDPRSLVVAALEKHGVDIETSRATYAELKQQTLEAIASLTQANPDLEKTVQSINNSEVSTLYIEKIKELGLPITNVNKYVRISAAHTWKGDIEELGLTEQQIISILKTTGSVIQNIKNPTLEMYEIAIRNGGGYYVMMNKLDELKNQDIDNYPAIYTLLAVRSRSKLPPEKEAVVAKDPELLRSYLRVRSGDWPEAEPAILTDGELIVRYMQNQTPARRWPAAEEKLLEMIENGQTEIWTLAAFARYSGMKRWPAAEPYILNDPDAAAGYALNVLHRRWPEAEDAMIKVDPEQDYGGTIQEYAKEFYWEEYMDTYPEAFDYDDYQDDDYQDDY